MAADGEERLIAEWTDKPFTSHRKRHITVEHRVYAVWYPGVGCDIRHEIRCDERGVPDFATAVAWEFRDHGVDKVQTAAGEALP